MVDGAIHGVFPAPHNLHASSNKRYQGGGITVACTAGQVQVTSTIYRICPYRSRTRIVARAQIEAGGQKGKSSIEAGSRIEAGPK